MTELLDSANTEPSRSFILELFSPYAQRGTPPIVQEIPPEWLDLAFADAARIDEVVAAALEVEPNISAREFRQFIEGRARAVQNIAAFLAANMTFGAGEDPAERTAELAASTLAYHLADEATKQRLIATFRAIAQSIADNTDDDQRALIRRSPLPPASVAQLKTWLTAEVESLKQAAAENRLLGVITPTVLELATEKSIRALSDRTIVPRALMEWVAGRSFAVIFETLNGAGIRVGRNHATIEDAVALCEDGFGFDIAMIIASIGDLAEQIDTDLHEAAASLQKQVKYGLPDKAAIAFHEAGFADRHVASMLAVAWPNVVDAAGARSVCRTEADVVRGLLASMPSYFTSIAAELAV